MSHGFPVPVRCYWLFVVRTPKHQKHYPMKRNIRRLLLLLCLFSPALLAAWSTQALQAANQAFQDKDYEQAIRKYEEILQQGYESEALYYNLGNAYYRSGEPGRAMLNYQRALKLDPGDENTLHNIEVVRAGLPDEIVTIRPSGVVKGWLSVQNALSSRAWSILGLAMVWLGAVGLAVFLLGSRRRPKKMGLAAGIILISLSMLPFLLAYGRSIQEFSGKKAVVMATETALRAAPEEDSKAVLALHEGVVVQIVDTIGSWYKVRLSDTREGWLPKDVVERV